MTDPAKAVPGVPHVTSLRLVDFLRSQTIVVLLLLLAAFVLAIEIVSLKLFGWPGTVNAAWASNIVTFAAPLGIMAPGQTLVMLPGGIDLSVASVATGSAYLMATHSMLGGLPAVLFGLAVGLGVGLINGVGIALLRVQPLIMTLGAGLMTEGMLVVYSQKMMAEGPHVPAFIVSLGGGKIFDLIPNDLFLWAPIAIAIILILRWTGYGRLLYAIGDN
ncbi:MAG: ABC transporter permease, partial [Hyphomicrobiales bacterium]|nr:ABC transporter permease [Hyphomicrobiales bacterium]